MVKFIKGTPYADRYRLGYFAIGDIRLALKEEGPFVKGQFLAPSSELCPTAQMEAVDALEKKIRDEGEVILENSQFGSAVLSPASGYSLLVMWKNDPAIIPSGEYHWKRDEAGIKRLEPGQACSRERVIIGDFADAFDAFINSDGSAEDVKAYVNWRPPQGKMH